MSIYSLAGLDIPFLIILHRQLEKVEIFRGTEETMCSLCRRMKSQELLILISRHQLDLHKTDLVLICSRCRLGRDNRQGETSVPYRLLIKTLSAVIDQEPWKEAIPLIQTITENIKKRPRNRGFRPQTLINDIDQKLIGWGYEQDDIEAYERYPRRTAALIQQFYDQLLKTYPVKYFKTQVPEFQIDKAFLNILQHFAKREKAFKIALLNHLVHISATTSDDGNMEEWLRKGLEGINHYQYSFTSLKKKEQTLFSICRRSIQYRCVYDEQEKETSKRELLITEVPMNERPFVFKVTSSGHKDDVEIGLLYTGKIDANVDCVQIGNPLLFKFSVGLRPDKLDIKPLIEPIQPRKRARLNRTENSQDSQPSSSSSQQRRPRMPKETYQVEDEDQLQLHLSHSTSTFTITNKTSSTPLLSSPIRLNSTQRYTIFGCVRLLGTRITVQSLSSS